MTVYLCCCQKHGYTDGKAETGTLPGVYFESVVTYALERLQI